MREAGYDFEVLQPVGVDERPRDAESPGQHVLRLARAKAESVARHLTAGTIIGCDTVAVCHGVILGKPLDREDARRMLLLLRDTEHCVLSGLCVLRVPENNARTVCETTRLRMLPIHEAEIDAYLATGLWAGKAGAFGLQDRTGWIEIVEGSPSNVVGIPMERLAELLGE